MQKPFEKLQKVGQKKIFLILSILFVLFIFITIFSWVRSSTISTTIYSNDIQIQTSYDYKATMRPTILYPDGGTIEVNDTILRNITSAIPLSIKATISSDNPIAVNGTHEVQVKITSGEYWERIFPLEEKQTFKTEGTEINILNNATDYKIDLEQINNFIQKVEDEIQIRPEAYIIEIIPNIQGTISFDDTEEIINLTDNLIFQQYSDEIILASEKDFTSSIPFTNSIISQNSINLFSFEIPVTIIRTISTVCTFLILVLMIYMKKNLTMHRKKSVQLESKKINKRYKNRLIHISQKIDTTQKSIIPLNAFKHLIQIADSKELPIFYYSHYADETKLYFVIDGSQLYQYEIHEAEFSRGLNENDQKESDASYVLD